MLLKQEKMERKHCLEYTLKVPSISRETLHKAIEKLNGQCDGAPKAHEILPEAVYIKHLPSYDEFFSNFLVRNQLCILSKEATREWQSRRDWLQRDGSPNTDFLSLMFGDSPVPVANCKKREFSSHMKEEMTMRDFLVYWQQSQEAGEGHDGHSDSLYLKDWHFTRAFPDYEAYSALSFFRSDWMNEFWDVREDIDDDYRFVYMGPRGTWTPFHSDVFRSFSWSANICGRKKWIFYPPGEEEYLKDIYGKLAYDVTSEEFHDRRKFPNSHLAKHRIELIQNPGETIFVPSGWHHQVHNLDHTISINHNWLNGCNARLCWAHLKDALCEVRKEISDCQDMDGWDDQCQLILSAYTGLDYKEFFTFMESIAKRRIQALEQWRQLVTETSGATADRDTPKLLNDTNPFSPTVLSTQMSGGHHGAKWGEEDTGKVAQRCVCEKGEKQDAPVVPLSEVASLESDADLRHGQALDSEVCQNRVPKTEPVTNVEISDALENNADVGGKVSGQELEDTKWEENGETNNNSLNLKGSLENLTNGTVTATGASGTLKTSRSSCGHAVSMATGPSRSFQTQHPHTTDISGNLKADHFRRTDISSDVLDTENTLLNLYEFSPKSRIPKEPHWARLNVNHALFDLASVYLVVWDMVKTGDIESLVSAERREAPRELLQSVKGTLQRFGVCGRWCKLEM